MARKILERFRIVASDCESDDLPEITLLAPSDNRAKPLANNYVIRFETSDGWLDIDAHEVAAALRKAELQNA